MNIKLDTIFIDLSKEISYHRSDLFSLKIQNNFIQKLSKQLQLSYQENEYREGNLCFNTNQNLRSEYKITFSHSDVVYFVMAHLKNGYIDLKEAKVKLPTNSMAFWDTIERGKKN